MNQTIANIIKERISDLYFIDKLAGLVSTVYMDVIDDEGNRVQKSYPVACDVTADDCKQGAYNDLAPDSQYKTVIYFEDRGVTFVRREGRWTYYKSSLRLVCWINVSKLKADCCKTDANCAMSAEIIKAIICALPQYPENIDPYDRVYPVIMSQEIRSNSIFSAYTYNEKQVQYLMSPYDYFALNIDTDFAICMDCE